MRARGLPTALALCAAAVAGCGLGPGKDEGDVSLTVTRDYGSKVMLQKTDSIRRVRHRDPPARPQRGHHHPLRRRLHPVDRRARRWPERRAAAATGSSTSTASSRRSARPSTTPPAATASGGTTATGPPRCACRRWSAPGRSRSCTDSRGTAGRRSSIAGPRRRPAKPPTSVCRRLASRRSGPTADAIEVLVGTWNVVRTNRSAALLADGPDQSGVFARFVGTRRPLLEVLNQQGQPAGSIGKGGGLIAALRPGDGPPTWVVTGTDAKGVAAAAGLLGDALRNHYALATQPGQREGRSAGAGAVRARPRVHAWPQPAAPCLARRLDRLPGCAGARRLRLLEPAGPARSRRGHGAGRLCGRGGPSRPGLAAVGAAAAPLHGPHQCARHPPGRHGPGAGLGDAGARQHRHHARVPGGGCGHRPQGGGGGSGVRRLLRLRRPRPRSPRPSPDRATLGDDGGARHAHGPARRRRRRTPEGGGGAARAGRRAGRAGRPGATPGRGLAGSRGRRGGHTGAARTLAGGAAADPARALPRRCAADPDRRRDRARRGRRPGSPPPGASRPTRGSPWTPTR